jgi:hypothetical protein
MREMQIKATMKYHRPPVRTAKTGNWLAHLLVECDMALGVRVGRHVSGPSFQGSEKPALTQNL